MPQVSGRRELVVPWRTLWGVRFRAAGGGHRHRLCGRFPDGGGRDHLLPGEVAARAVRRGGHGGPAPVRTSSMSLWCPEPFLQVLQKIQIKPKLSLFQTGRKCSDTGARHKVQPHVRERPSHRPVLPSLWRQHAPVPAPHGPGRDPVQQLPQCRRLQRTRKRRDTTHLPEHLALQRGTETLRSDNKHL